MGDKLLRHGGIIFSASVVSFFAGYLVWYALGMGLLSLAVIFMFYDVSAKRTAFRYPLVVFTAMQVFLLVMFHESIEQIIGVQIVTFLILLISVVMINRRYESYT